MSPSHNLHASDPLDALPQLILPPIFTAAALPPLLAYLYTAALPDLSDFPIGTVIGILQAGDFLGLPFITEHVQTHLLLRPLPEEFEEATEAVEMCRPGAVVADGVHEWFSMRFWEATLREANVLNLVKILSLSLLEVVLQNVAAKGVTVQRKLKVVRLWLQAHNMLTNPETEISKNSKDDSIMIIDHDILTKSGRLAVDQVFPVLGLHNLSPDLIEKEVEPLGIFSSRQLLAVYRQIAKKQQFISNIMRTPFHGNVIFLHCPTVNYSTCVVNHPLTSVSTFIVQVLKRETSVWVGVADDSIDLTEWAGRERGAWILGSNAILFHENTMENSPDANRFGEEWGEGAHIEVTVNMYERTVSFKINGMDYGVAFSGLPDTQLYPCFSSNQNSLATIEFVEEN
ncbi:hypothetical protein HK096_003012 [Nowakowskiella sp. JEL0078]|nr:hypothetical protein HK096_003012 [Nowakowskiella sp. JEL0078]